MEISGFYISEVVREEMDYGNVLRPRISVLSVCLSNILTYYVTLHIPIIHAITQDTLL